jgi:TolA-binding protein
MSNGIKIGLYLALILGATIFGYLAYRNYTFADVPVDGTPLPLATNRTTRVAESSNTNQPSSAGTATGTNLTPTATAAVDPTNAAPNDAAVQTKSEIDPRTARGTARAIGYGAGFFVMVVGLALLLGNDISNFFGNRALKLLYDDEGETPSTPEYEIAEQEWANGNYLEAIRLMRDYLNQHPREQHVALRIAEIYEKDLQNPLAAALEYEEVLKHRLPAERWGWAAIHLCNLYFRLGQQEKAVTLLRRIDSEYGHTSAAEKARKRLAQLEPSSNEIDESESESESEPAAEPEPPPSNLPPGFKLKKNG